MEKKKSMEIDVIGILQELWKHKKYLCVVTFIAAIIGVIVALSKPKEWTANVILAPEMSSGGLGLSETLGDMASTFGIDLGSKSSVDAIYPEIYPDIFSSTDFIVTLFDVPVELWKTGEKKTYFQHIVLDAKMPFWDYPMFWLKQLFKKKEEGSKDHKLNIFELTKGEYNVCMAIRSSISCLVDKKTSVITINVTDNDPKVAAIVADTLQSRLQKYIVDYRTKKARNDYDYYCRLYDESRDRYYKAQKLYASYVDGNQEVTLQSLKSKQDDLENDMQLKFNVMNQMTTQMQAAKAKIQERTPAFTMIQSPSVPHKASSTPRSVIAMLFTMLGFIIGALWVLYGKALWDGRKKNKNGKETKADAEEEKGAGTTDTEQIIIETEKE